MVPTGTAASSSGQQPADTGRSGSLRLGSEGVRAGLAGQPGQAVGVPPGGGQGTPAIRGFAFGPSVVVDGRQQPATVSDREQSGRGSALEHERGVAVVGAEDPTESGDVADGHAALPQQSVRRGLQGVGDQLDVVHEPVRGTDGSPVDQCRCAHATRQRRGGPGHRLGAEPFVAQVPGDLAGQQHGVGAGRPQQPPSQQVLHRRPSSVDGDRPIGAVDRAGGVPQQPFDHGARLGPDLGEPGVDLGRRERAGRGWGQTAGVGAQVVASGSHQVQLVIVSPQQRPVTQIGDGASGAPRFDVQQIGQGGQGHRIGQRGQRLGDQPLPRVQPVERPADGARGGGLRRQLRDVPRNGVGQVRAQRQQAGEGVGVEPPQGLGQRAGSGDGRRGGGTGHDQRMPAPRAGGGSGRPCFSAR